MSKTDTTLTMMRFPNLSGALVVVTATELGRRTRYAWHCSGCLYLTEGGDLYLNREQANDHSATCRALPQPEPSATK